MTAIRTDFGAAGAAYAAWRPGYPEALFERIAAALPPPRRRAADLGAGTGLSTLPLSRLFDEVIAVEPDPGMAERLRGLAPNVALRTCRAEEADLEPGSLDLVACGNALYWMDGPEVVARAASWLRRGGLLAIWRYGFPQAPAAVQAIAEREMRERWGAHQHPRLRDTGYSLRAVAGCPRIGPPDVSTVPNVVEMDARSAVGFFQSTSYGSAWLRTAADPGGYLSDLEAEIHEAAGLRPFPVDLSLHLILAGRTGGRRTRAGSP